MTHRKEKFKKSLFHMGFFGYFTRYLYLLLTTPYPRELNDSRFRMTPHER
jgi:hypothetical protein